MWNAAIPFETWLSSTNTHLPCKQDLARDLQERGSLPWVKVKYFPKHTTWVQRKSHLEEGSFLTWVCTQLPSILQHPIIEVTDLIGMHFSYSLQTTIHVSVLRSPIDDSFSNGLHHQTKTTNWRWLFNDNLDRSTLTHLNTLFMINLLRSINFS